METKIPIWLKENAWRVLNSVVDSIVIISSRGSIQYVNEATLKTFGYKEHELLGSSLAMLMPAPYSDEHEHYVSRYLKSGDAHIIGIGRELSAQTKTGRIFPIYLAISEISDHGETFFAGIIHDLTAQEAARSKMLEQQNELAHVGRVNTMGELTASIAHEINQPLTAIAMYAQACLRMLDKEDIDKKRLSEAMDKLVVQSLRAGTVIERVQRFVRKESGQRELIDINSLIMDLKPLVEGDASLHEIELVFSLGRNLKKIMCDAIQIQQVALNLIRNAVDAMVETGCKNGSKIVISSAQNSDDTIQILVKDSGTGVKADQADFIFSAFHTTKVEGMGMGLSICRSIIERHGGVLEFHNNPDAGASFYFCLPLSIEPDTETTKMPDITRTTMG